MRLLWIAPLVLVAGCAALKKADAPVTMRLAPPTPALAGAPIRRETVAVAPVAARGIAGQLRYTYVADAAPAVLQQARTMFWEESPTHAAERALVASLRTRFAGALEPGMGGAADLRLIARLDRFEEVAAGADAAAVVALSVTLTGPRPMVGSYCRRVPIAGAAPSDRAAAFDAALASVADRVAQDAAAGAFATVSC